MVEKNQQQQGDSSNLPLADDTNNAPPVVPTTLHWDLSVDTDDKKDLPQTQQTPPQSTPLTTIQGVVSDKYLDDLMDVLEKHNLPGFDYLEFRHVVNLSESGGSDEKTRYGSALTLAKAMGRTPDQLLEDARHYLSILQQENQNFSQNVLLSITQQIGYIEKKINEVLADINAKEAQILALQTAIKDNEKAIEALKIEASAVASQIETNKANFSASCDSVLQQIEADIFKIEKYKPI